MFHFPHGVCPILATPFSEAGEVDYGSLRKLSRELIRMGVSGITMFGIAGEYYKLSDREKEKMVEVVIETVGNEVPVIVSVTSHATELAVQEARKWERIGANMLMLLPPFFLKPGPDALQDHVEQVCEAVGIPVMLQYAPEQTGVSMGVSFFLDLMARFPQLCLKIENKPPGKLISALMEKSAGTAKVYIGNAGFQMLEGLQRGAIGLMPGSSMSDIYIRIYELCRQSEWNEAIRLHNQLLGVLNCIRQNVEQIIACEKKILKLRGFIESDYCRKPTFEFDRVYQSEFDTYVSTIHHLLVEA